MKPPSYRSPSLRSDIPLQGGMVTATTEPAMTTLMKNADARLVEKLNELSDRPDGWTAIIFNLSGLLDEYKSEYQVRIAVNLINDLLKMHEGGIFVCADGTIAVLCSDLTTQLRNKLIFQLRYLYMDDPLAYTDDGNENVNFCNIYNLETHVRECLQHFTRRLARPGRAPEAPSIESALRMATASEVAASIPQATHAPIDPKLFSASRLANIEQDILHADLSRTTRRQAVCAFTPAGTVRRVFDELYINITHLREQLKADVDFLSNKWLFKYMTQVLDKRVLTMLAQNTAHYLAQPLSVNLNVETLLSDDFAQFDAAISPASKVAVVFEIHVVDFFADAAGFTYACENAQKRGYRICLDGLTDHGFLQIDRARLGVDLVKLQWNADFADDVGKRENKPLREAILECGANRVILCRCDTVDAVEYGQALGISLFQGRYLDSLIDPAAKVRN